MGQGKMEKPEEERSLLLKCLPPVGNISKQSGTKNLQDLLTEERAKGSFLPESTGCFQTIASSPATVQMPKCQVLQAGSATNPAKKLQAVWLSQP